MIKVRSHSCSNLLFNPSQNANYSSCSTHSNYNTITPYKDRMFDTKRRCANPNVYKSFSFEKIYNNSQAAAKDSGSINEYVYKPSTKAGQYSSYGKTTQIVHLPGGVKRNVKDINDDGDISKLRAINKWDKPSYNTKVCKDYKSNVECLPGTGTVVVMNRDAKRRTISHKRYDCSDIFNVNYDYHKSNGKTFKQFCGRKMNMSKRSNNESCSDIYQGKFQGIKKSYKNYSQIQLC